MIVSFNFKKMTFLLEDLTVVKQLFGLDYGIAYELHRKYYQLYLKELNVWKTKEKNIYQY